MNVTIVGAGVVGCAIAHELALRGAHVRVVDPRGVGHGATHASAGMLAPHIEAHGADLLTLGLRSLALYDDLIDRLRDEASHAVEYDRSGTLQVALDARHAAHLRDEAARLGNAGVQHALLPGAEIKRAEPCLTSDIVAGLLLPGHGFVSAAGLTTALAEAATHRGAQFMTDRVVGIASGKTGAQVTTSGGTIDADAIVIAAGSWSCEVAGISSRPPPVKPIRGQLLRLRAHARVAARIIWGSGCYIVPWHDGSVLVGATVEDAGFDESATAAGVQQLLTAAFALLPALRTARFEEVRVGLRPMTADELPIIGPSSTMRHVFYATGHYRNGILLAPLTARMIAGLVLDEREEKELALTRPARLGL